MNKNKPDCLYNNDSVKNTKAMVTLNIIYRKFFKFSAPKNNTKTMLNNNNNQKIPVSAKHVPVNNPTYPVPITDIFIVF